MRHGEIARDDALTPFRPGRLRRAGTTFADDFIAAERIEEHDGGPGIEARGYWEGIRFRLKQGQARARRRVFIPILFLVAFVGAPVAAHFLGHGPNEPIFASGGVDAELLPAGPLTYVQATPATGTREADPHSRRRLDPRSRRVPAHSLRRPGVARGGGGGDVDRDVLGLLLGAVAGFYRGYADTVISRVTEITMAFPYLLFVIALASTVGSRLDKVTFGFLGQGVVTLVIVFGLFSWFYSARVFRGDHALAA